MQQPHPRLSRLDRDWLPGERWYGLIAQTDYTVVKGVITLYTGSADTLEIPAVINGQTIVGIGSSAFSGRTNLTSVTFGTGLTSIGSDAFIWCDDLASVTFKANAPTVGSSAFLVTRTPHPVAYRAATLTGYGIDGSSFYGLTVATPGT